MKFSIPTVSYSISRTDSGETKRNDYWNIPAAITAPLTLYQAEERSSLTLDSPKFVEPHSFVANTYYPKQSGEGPSITVASSNEVAPSSEVSSSNEVAEAALSNEAIFSNEVAPLNEVAMASPTSFASCESFEQPESMPGLDAYNLFQKVRNFTSKIKDRL